MILGPELLNISPTTLIESIVVVKSPFKNTFNTIINTPHIDIVKKLIDNYNTFEKPSNYYQFNKIEEKEKENLENYLPILKIGPELHELYGDKNLKSPIVVSIIITPFNTTIITKNKKLAIELLENYINGSSKKYEIIER